MQHRPNIAILSSLQCGCSWHQLRGEGVFQRAHRCGPRFAKRVSSHITVHLLQDAIDLAAPQCWILARIFMSDILFCFYIYFSIIIRSDILYFWLILLPCALGDSGDLELVASKVAGQQSVERLHFGIARTCHLLYDILHKCILASLCSCFLWFYFYLY